MIEAQAKMYARVIAQLFLRRHIASKLTTVNRGARHLSYGLRLSNPEQLDNALKLAEYIALAANSKAVLAQRQNGFVVYQFELTADYWKSYTRQDLPTTEAIGLAEKRKPINFTFKQPHALVAGTTDSGKSETVKSILLSLMTSYKPTELKIVICDLHDDYPDFDNESHLVMPIAGNQNEIQNALLFVNNKLIKRKQQGIKNDYKLVLVIDEADKILSDERLAIVQSLTQEGRKFNIHVIIATQKPSHTDLPKILDNLNNRYVGLVSDAKISYMLTGKSGLQCHQLTGHGDFVNVCGIENERFQVAQATTEDFNNLERGEIKPVKIPESDVVLLPETKPVGRPPLTVDSEILAYYYHYGPDNISIAQANKALKLSRYSHSFYKAEVRKFAKQYLELRSLNNNLCGKLDNTS